MKIQHKYRTKRTGGQNLYSRAMGESADFHGITTKAKVFLF